LPLLLKNYVRATPCCGYKFLCHCFPKFVQSPPYFNNRQ
jgi:hypothetical protein